MNKKNFLFSIAFLLITSFTIAQDYKKEIRTEFNDYLNAIINQEFEEAMNYVTDDFFKIIPKAQMIQLMEQTFNNPEMEFELKNPEEESVEDRKLRNSLMKVNFQKNFSVDNVSYDETKDQYQIKSTKEVYAISENGNINWKFLVVEKKQKFILEQLLPKELVDRAYKTTANN